MAISIVLVALWPGARPLMPEPVRPGPGVTHVEAATQNHHHLERYRALVTRRRVRVAGSVVAVA
ncbi:MAG: hypothetical protein ACREH8_11110, partial [Opitutaceae bacterium]